MMIINRKRREKIDWLLPGWKFDEPLTLGLATSVSGDLFEGLTETILSGKRRTTNSETDICPDLIDEDKGLMIESKASSMRSGVKVGANQLKRYGDMAKEGWAVKYVLWMYNIEGLLRRFDTIGECVKGMVDSVELAIVLDLPGIEALVDSDVDGVHFYEEWSEKWARIRGYRMPLWVVRPRLLRLLAAGDSPTLETCGLGEAAGYARRETKRTAGVNYNGVRFATSQFKLVTFEQFAPF